MKYLYFGFEDVFIKLVWENERFADWSKGFLEEDFAWVFEISLKVLPNWEDSSSWEDFWLIVCKTRSNSGDLDRVSTKFCTLSLCIYEGFVAFSSAITASYQEVIGFAEDMTKAISFRVLWVF